MSSALPPASRHALSSEFANEINALSREVLKAQPADVLQFCADFFTRRLAAQRHEFHLLQAQQATSRIPGKGDPPRDAGMSSSFPGSNPFKASPPPTRDMHQLAEEDEENDTVASPTTTRFPNSSSYTSSDTMFEHGSDHAADHVADKTAFANPDPFDPSGAAGLPHHQMDAQAFPTGYNLNRRTSVSAESLAPSSQQEGADSTWKPPHHPKTAEQQARLRQAVAHNFLFSHLDDEQSAIVLNALVEKPIPARGIKVIVQGDVGDAFYVVEAGHFDIHVNASGKLEAGPAGMGPKVSSVGPGGSFGELALMYNAPRAATVVSTAPSTLWALDRITFRRILMDSAFARRRMYESFLDSVPLLATLTAYERSKIADALETQKFPANTTIIREGDVGSHFYILEAGAAEAYKRGAEKSVKRYQKGDYFGELALLNDAPRAASVVSTTDVKVACLGKDGFRRLLGPVEEIMRREKYEGQMVDPLSTPLEKTDTVT